MPKKKSKKEDSYSPWLRIIGSFIILGIIFSFFGPTGFLFPGLFLFAVIFKIILNVTWGESFKLGFINVVFNGLVTVALISLIFSGQGDIIHFIHFFGGIVITRLFLNTEKIIRD